MQKRLTNKINTMKNKIKNLYKNLIKPFVWLINQLKNTLGLIISLWHLIGKANKIKVFYGYWHWSISKKYAHKRYNKYPITHDQKGKNQGVFAYETESLIVISPKEIKYLKKRRIIDNPKWYRKIFNKDNLYKVAQY